MKKLKTFIDERLAVGCCIFCGKEPSTNDHAPSKILLDEPYPPDLPVAPACKKCNEGFASDEEYVASIIECAIQGSIDSEKIRPKIKKTLEKQQGLKNRIAKGQKTDDLGNVIWEIDSDRLKNLLYKLASGHAYYELELPTLAPPSHVGFMPLALMTSSQLSRFELSYPILGLLPEMGTRALQRLLMDSENTWQIVQPNRYRYRVQQYDYLAIQIVLSEYLAGEVIWSSS